MAEAVRPAITETLLQELLLALLGFFGDVFVNCEARRLPISASVPDPAACSIRVAAHVDWMGPPDRCSLHRCQPLQQALLMLFLPFGRSSKETLQLVWGFTSLLVGVRAGCYSLS